METSKRVYNIFMMLTLLLVNFSCRNENKTADLIITDAEIWTGNKDQP